MPNYRRVWVPGGTFFFTANLQDRERDLLITHVDALRAAFHEARAARPFEVIAVVVLPEHLHCVWTLPEGDADNATRWRHIKALFSRALPASERRSGARMRKAERGLWQRRYWERQLRDALDLQSHVDYIHYNPVKHGHVERAVDWPYSSIHRYVRQGVLSPEWGTSMSAFARDAGAAASRGRGVRATSAAGQDPCDRATRS